MARGWMIILCPDADAKADGVEDEAFMVIYKKLTRAKERCREALHEDYDATRGGEPELEIETDEIEWAEDSSSTKQKKVYFGRPKASVDCMFYLYQVWIE